MPNIHKLYGHVRFKSKMYVLFTNPFHNHLSEFSSHLSERSSL